MHSWSGDEIIEALQQRGITKEAIPTIAGCIAGIEDLHESGRGISAKAIVILLDLDKILRFLYSEIYAFLEILEW